jgi:hypothetical protein
VLRDGIEQAAARYGCCCQDDKGQTDSLNQLSPGVVGLCGKRTEAAKTYSNDESCEE